MANINSVKLKEEIKKAGYTQVRLAEELEITQNSLSSKITGKSEWEFFIAYSLFLPDKPLPLEEDPTRSDQGSV